MNRYERIMQYIDSKSYLAELLAFAETGQRYPDINVVDKWLLWLNEEVCKEKKDGKQFL